VELFKACKQSQNIRLTRHSTDTLAATTGMVVDRETIEAVAEDLLFLRNWEQTIKNDEIRRGSSTLRMLLVDGLYGNA
jgi:hypothetical protein